MLALNQQNAEAQVISSGGTLDVVNIWKTIQGEGPFAGFRAVFIRLAGCNLKCVHCDTDYTSNRRELTTKEIVEAVFDCTNTFDIIPHGDKCLVVITGGEPFRQPLAELCTKLLRYDFLIQIETNGTKFHNMDIFQGNIHVVCSPKTTYVNPDLKPVVSSLKYVLDAGHVCEYDGLPTSVLGMPIRPARPWADFNGPIYIQPEDRGNIEYNAKNMIAVRDSCLKYGYRASLQMHKILGVE